MSERVKVPAIRFKGFNTLWEHRKLKEIADFGKGYGYTKSDLKKAGTPIILYGRLYTKYQSIIREVDTFAEVISGAIISRGGEVISPSSGETAEDIAIASCVKNPGFLLGGGLNIVFPHSEVESEFLAIEISFGPPHYELVKRAQGKSIVHLYNEDLKEVIISFPSLEEQKKISLLFDNLDRLITLEQRKLAKLKNVKEALLEKMFPQEGESVPQIRFAGFSGAWEQKKLGEIGTFNPKSELPDVFEYVDLESVIGSEMLWHRTENKKTAPSRAQRLAQVGDVFYQTVRPYQKNNYLFEKTDNKYVFSTGYAQIRSNYDGYYIMCLIQNQRFVNDVLKKCTGTSYPAINANDLAEITISSTDNMFEQRMIGKCFRSIDNLVVLYQQKIEKLQNFKKACLEKMFV